MFSKTFAGIFKSFEHANRQKMLLGYRFSIPKPYKIVSESELQSAFRQHPSNDIRDGWEGFRESFPDSSGYLILSGVGFNSDRTMALVYIEHRCGNMCGASRYYILQKRDGEWARCEPKGLKSEMRGSS